MRFPSGMKICWETIFVLLHLSILWHRNLRFGQRNTPTAFPNFCCSLTSVSSLATSLRWLRSSFLSATFDFDISFFFFFANCSDFFFRKISIFPLFELGSSANKKWLWRQSMRTHAWYSGCSIKGFWSPADLLCSPKMDSWSRFLSNLSV